MNTASSIDDKFREKVALHAQSVDPSFNKDQAIPSNLRPVLDKKTTGDIKAENVGFEEFNEDVESKGRDFQAILKGIFKPVMGGTEKREGPVGKIWNKIKKLKSSRESKIKTKNDPEQELE